MKTTEFSDICKAGDSEQLLFAKTLLFSMKDGLETQGWKTQAGSDTSVWMAKDGVLIDIQIGGDFTIRVMRSTQDEDPN